MPDEDAMEHLRRVVADIQVHGLSRPWSPEVEAAVRFVMQRPVHALARQDGRRQVVRTLFRAGIYVVHRAHHASFTLTHEPTGRAVEQDMPRLAVAKWLATTLHRNAPDAGVGLPFGAMAPDEVMTAIAEASAPVVQL